MTTNTSHDINCDDFKIDVIVTYPDGCTETIIFNQGIGVIKKFSKITSEFMRSQITDNIDNVEVITFTIIAKADDNGILYGVRKDIKDDCQYKIEDNINE